MWLDMSVKKLQSDKKYSRNEILSFLRKENPDLSNNSMDWLIYRLVMENRIYRLGRDTYSLTKPDTLSEYVPEYSTEAMKMIQFLDRRFSRLKFVVLECSLLNEFLNHQIAQNTIYLQVEKEVASLIYETIRNEYSRKVLLTPGKKEMELYWEPGCIIIINLVSQAPINNDNPHYVSLEKLLVDIVADKSIATSFSPSELPDIYEMAVKNYRLDRAKLKRYAGRRNKKEEVDSYLEDI